MKTVEFDGEMESIYGKPYSAYNLTEPLKYKGEFKELETKDEVIAADEWPTDKQAIEWANNRRKATARQQAMNKAATDAGIDKPTLESDVQLQLKTLIRVYRAAKKTEEEAIKLAEDTLGAVYER